VCAGFQGPGCYASLIPGGRSTGWGVQGSRYRGTKFSRVLFNSTCMKASRWPRVAELGLPDSQWGECTGDVDSGVYILHPGTSVEQQIKLPFADIAHVSDSDARVACGTGLPRSCRIPNRQILFTKRERDATIGPHSGGRENPFPC